MKKKLKGAIIGYGFIASQGHMPAYRERMGHEEDVDILGVCDICVERRKELPLGVRLFENYRDLLREIGHQLDFVDICTHASDHYRIAKTCLEHGLHVLCEKPLTTSLEEAEDLIVTALSQKRVLFPCHNYKHAPVVQAIRNVIHSGKIGKNSLRDTVYFSQHSRCRNKRVASGLEALPGV